MRLPRLQLVELNDLHQTPAPIRDSIVEALSRTLRWGRMLDGLVPALRGFLEEAGTHEILDLGAGAGGPAGILAEAFARGGGRAPRILLTDLFPRLEEWRSLGERHPGVIDHVSEPVDATAVPRAHAEGRVRTVINVFHHFPPPLARRVLLDAVSSSRGIFVSEAFGRNPLAFLSFAPLGLPALLATPILSPRDRLAKAALTWGTPLVLGASIWDGLVSTMRTYEEDEIRELTAGFGDHWRWEFGTYDFWPLGRGRWFYGLPRS